MTKIGTLLILIGFLILSTARGRDVSKMAPSLSGTEVRAVTPMETDALLRRGKAVLIDVREAKEIRAGMAGPARWMPLSRMKDGDPVWERLLAETPKETLVVCYCAAGKRAETVALALRAKGYEVANMGGYSDWVAAGLPTNSRSRGVTASSAPKDATEKI